MSDVVKIETVTVGGIEYRIVTTDQGTFFVYETTIAGPRLLHPMSSVRRRVLALREAKL